jgi:magnesium transporter
MLDPRLLTQIADADDQDLIKLFEDLLPADLAEALSELARDEQVRVAKVLSPTIFALVLEEMEYTQAASLLADLPLATAVAAVDQMSSDDAADLLAELPPELMEQVLAQLTDQQQLRQLLAYDEDSSGGIMATEFLAVRPNWSTDKALTSVREKAREAETAYYVYVTDRANRLRGVLSLRELVLAPPNTPIWQIMHENPIAVKPDDDQESVAALFRHYHLLALPVVNEAGVLQGIITGDDILEVVDEEATEDIHRMAAMAPPAAPYLQSSTFKLASQRLTWLLVLMVSATFTGQIIRSFEGILSQIVSLAVFIPVLMDTGGNAGSQSATMIIRGLALGEISLRDWFKVMRQELGVGAMVGVSLALVNFVRILLVEGYAVEVAAVVSITLLTTVMLAKLIGGLLPILAKSARLDPAIMAGPMITTIVDALALLCYFWLASMLLGGH